MLSSHCLPRASVLVAGEAAAGAGRRVLAPRRPPNCHLLEIIEICVLKFVLHCTCMKCSSVFRTTVVKVIVDNAPPTWRTWLPPPGRTKPAGPGGCVVPRRGVPAGERAWPATPVAGPMPRASGVAETRARTASATAPRGAASPALASRPGRWRR